MNKLQDKKEITKMSVLFSLTYMISYMTRINLGAIIAEVENETGISRTLLSMSVTGCFATYGAGQIVSGICGDRFSPKKLVSVGLTASSLMNIIMSLCKTPYTMLIAWSINGFAQAFMWPPMVRIMTGCLSNDDYRRVSVSALRGGSFGTIAVYLISPLIISLLGWKWVFIFCGGCGLVMLVFWNLSPYEVKTERKANTAKTRGGDNSILLNPTILMIMFAIILQGMLRDGVSTWMPSYISETYNLSSAVSILSGVILPVFSILCLQITSALYRKVTNPIKCGGMLFLTGTLSGILLYMLTGKVAFLSVFFYACLTGSMHGVNMMLITMLPPYFEKYGNVSTISGALNACTYIGSAISTYGIALLSETKGWNFTLVVWIIIALSGTLICMSSIKGWDKLMDEE